MNQLGSLLMGMQALKVVPFDHSLEKLCVGFSSQEHWSGLPFPPPGDLSDPEIEPESLTSPALADGLFTTSVPWEAPMIAGKVANAFLAPSPRQKARLGRPENQSSHGR